MLEDVDVFAGHLVVPERDDGACSCASFDLATRRRARDRLRRAGLQRRTRAATPSSTPTTLRFVYTSLTTPASVYDYDVATRERVLRSASRCWRLRSGAVRERAH